MLFLVPFLHLIVSLCTSLEQQAVCSGNVKEKLVAMLGMVIGVTVFGYFMGSMGSMLMKTNYTEVCP